MLKGYELGADDYVTKPFPMSVFQKKVSALLARIRKQSGGDFYNDGNLFINFTEMTATQGGESISFNGTHSSFLSWQMVGLRVTAFLFWLEIEDMPLDNVGMALDFDVPALLAE